MAIKNYNTCKGCFYGAFNKFCSDGDCHSCPMNLLADNGNYDETFCKCNTVEVDGECPYYRELEE